MGFCNCEQGLSNLGRPNCETIQSVTKKLIYVPLFNTTGQRNFIDITDNVDEAYVMAKINEADSTLRWYPSPLIENVEDTKEDSVFETLESGSNIFIQEGARTFNGVHIKQSSVFLGKLKSGRCVDFGVYMIDINNQLTGSVSSDGTRLYPVAVDKETFNPTMVKATDNTVAKIQVTFEFIRSERDENLRSLQADVDFLSLNGLLDGYIAVSDEATTGVTLTVSTSYGAFQSPIKVEGLVIGDFTLNNLTTNAAITLDTVTEAAAGVYTVVFNAAQTAGDEIAVSIDRQGFDMDTVSYTI